MFSSISWSAYLAFIAVSTLIYYAFVIYMYYRHDLLRTLKGKQDPANSVHFTGDVSMQSTLPSAVNHEDYKPKLEDSIAQSFSDEVQAYLEQVSYGKPSKNEVIFGIHQVIKKYPSLPGTSYEAALSQLIGFSTKDKCAIHLSDEDIRQVWLV